MIKTIRTQIEKFEKTLFKNFGLLHLCILLTSFLPYLYAFDSHYSVWESLHEFSTIWKAASAIQVLYYFNLLLLLVCPICFLVCTILIYRKTKSHEGSVIYQGFMRRELEEDENFGTLLKFWLLSGMLYIFLIISSLLLLLTLIFSTKGQTLIPSFGFYLIFGLTIFWGIRLYNDIKKLFNLDTFIAQLQHDIIDEFNMHLSDWLKEEERLEKITFYYNLLFKNNLYNLKKNIPTAHLREKSGYSPPKHHFETKEQKVVIEKIKHIPNQPKLKVLTNGYTFTGYHFKEVNINDSKLLVLNVENSGKGMMKLEILSNLRSIDIRPKLLDIPEREEREVKIYCSPGNDPALTKGVIQKGQLFFKYSYEHNPKETHFNIRITAEGYESRVFYKPVLAGLSALFYLMFLPSLFGRFLPETWQENIMISNNNNLYPLLILLLSGIGPVFLSWYIGKKFFTHFPKGWKALLLIPFLTVTVSQGFMVALAKSNIGGFEKYQPVSGFSYATVNANRGLIVRQSSSTSSKRLSTLTHNAKVQILTDEGEWVQIAYGDDLGQTGYVLKKYLTIIKN